MMFTTRRPLSRIDVYNYNTLLHRDYDADINFTKSYFLSQSPPPMTYRDLRSVMSNIKSSNVVILPESLNSSDTLTNNSPQQNRRKHTSRKKHKRQGVNVYRTLTRVESRCSGLSERNITNDEMRLLANASIIDHVSPAPTSGFFHPQNLPNIQKRRINNNRIENNQSKSSYSSSPSLSIHHVGHTRPISDDIQYEDNNQTGITSQTKSNLRIQHVGHKRPTPPQITNRTASVDIQYEENKSEMTITTTTTITSLPTHETPIRRQLHVYMPQILSC